jgi:hypothetical protein
MAGEFLGTYTEGGGRTQEQVEALASGYQRLVGLGMYGPQPQDQRSQEALQRVLGRDFTQQGYDLMAQQYQMGAQRRQMGLFWQPPVWEQYMGELTPEFIAQQQQAAAIEQQQLQALDSVYQGFNALGMQGMNMQPYEGYTVGELSQLQSVQQMGQQLQGMLPTAGWNRQGAIAMGQAFTDLDPRHARRLFGMGQGNQDDWARYMIDQPDTFRQMVSQYGVLQGMGGSMIDMSAMGMVDIMQGPNGPMMTGLPWGSSSLATPFQSSQQMAQRIWGADYQNQAGLSQGLIGAMIEGGTFGGQLWQQQQAAAQQQSQSGIQLQQLALTRAFQTGVGIGDYSGITNPQTGQPFGFNTGKFNVNVRGVGGFQTQGGGLWGVQDAMRGLGYMQQEWQIGRQFEQLEMQDTFWQQNFNLNMRGAMMQRPWRREDWAFQDQQRAMQWSWRQEDFQEESRFMTGRDRRLAERDMARETIMYGMEGEQIDRQRERQEDLWDLEDERFQLQEAQQKAQIEFQEEGIKKQELFYEERKRLEEEQIALTRAYYTEQMKLQEEQISAAAAYARVQQEIAETMLIFRQEAERLMAQGGLFDEDSWASVLSILSELDPALAEAFFEAIMKGMKDVSSNQPDGGPENWEDDGADTTQPPASDNYDYSDKRYRQHGGGVLAGQEYYVGEAGVEKFKPYFTGDILPSYKTNPWETTMIEPSAATTEQQLIHLILNLGDEHFREYILKAVDSEIDV